MIGEADEPAGESTQAAVPRALPAMLRGEPTARGTSHLAALESRAKLFGSSGGRRKSSCGPRAGFCKELAPRSCGASLLPIKTLGSPTDAAGRADHSGDDGRRDGSRAGVRRRGVVTQRASFHPTNGSVTALHTQPTAELRLTARCRPESPQQWGVHDVNRPGEARCGETIALLVVKGSLRDAAERDVHDVNRPGQDRRGGNIGQR